MKATIFAVVVLAFSVNDALAVSRAVKMACRDDYFAHCSMHAVGSPGVRKCMRDVGPRLSSQCISALAASGEIRKEKVVYKKKYHAKKIVSKKHYAKHSTKKKYVKKQHARKHDTKKTYTRKQYARRYLARS